MCPKCGKEYASNFAFRTHLAIHAANEGELMCGVCKGEFTEKSLLLQHLKIHAGARSVKDSERNHSCPLCNKLFFTRKDVARHLVVHTKNRDFLCQYCPQRFGRRDHLVRHLKRAHATEAAAEGWDLPDLDFKDTLTGVGAGKGKAKKTVLPPGPSEESLDRRLEGDANVVSELLQSVGVRMSDETPIAQKSAPKRVVMVENQNQPVRTMLSKQQEAQLQQVLLQSTNQPGGAQFVTIPISLTGQQVQELSSGFVPPVLPTNVQTASQPQEQSQQHLQSATVVAKGQSQQQQVAAIMTKLGQNFVQLSTPTATQTLNLALQQQSQQQQQSTSVDPGSAGLVSSITSASNVTGESVSAVLDLLVSSSTPVMTPSLTSSSEDRDAAAKLTLLSNAAALPQQVQTAQHLVDYNDAVKLSNFTQFAENEGSQS